MVYTKETNFEKFGRCTLGRAESLVRIPLQLLTVAGLVAKM
jgi:hypothetical protein